MISVSDHIARVVCNYRVVVETVSLAEKIAIMLSHFRAIKEKYFPPEPEILTKCSEKTCLKAARIKMIDRALDFHVEVCFDHFKELRDQRDWDLE